MAMKSDEINDDGYRRTPRGGPGVRTDVVDVYVFRRRVQQAEKHIGETPPARHVVEFLQVLRASEPLAQTWHPVMGHIEPGETAVACALRELDEELGLCAGGGAEEDDAKKQNPALVGVWALEQVHPFFIAELDAIVMSPRFAAEVAGDWQPRLNDEHSAHRWVAAEDAARSFMWPGQHAAVREILEHLLPEGSLSRARLAVRLGGG